MANNQKNLTGVHLGGNHNHNGLIPRKTVEKTLNTVWVENIKTAITSQMATKSLRSGTLYFDKEELGFSPTDVVTNYLRSELAMELSLDKIEEETIIIIGRWDRNAFLWYIRILVSDLKEDISTLMNNKK